MKMKKEMVTECDVKCLSPNEQKWYKNKQTKKKRSEMNGCARKFKHQTKTK